MKNYNIKEIGFLTSEQVSKYLCIPLRTVQRLSKEGRIRCVKIGNQWKYAKPDIEHYISFGTDFSKEPARKPDDFIERRAYPRINTNFKCDYSINLPPFKNINSEGIVKDLNAGGILLDNSNEEINKAKINDPIDLEFNLISKVETVNIQVEGRIIRKQNNGLGVKFRNISNEDKNKIITYVG